jgi:hypothetical protein
VIKRPERFGFRYVLALSLSAVIVSSPRSRPPYALPLANGQIRVATNEVIVPVTVTDASGEFVRDLSQKDFHAFDDGVEQTIDHWDAGGDPLAIVLVLETSSRLHGMIPVISRAGKHPRGDGNASE